MRSARSIAKKFEEMRKSYYEMKEVKGLLEWVLSLSPSLSVAVESLLWWWRWA